MTQKKECPRCGSPMVIRTAKKGINTGNKFYGCSRYPDCKGTREIDEKNETSRTEDQPALNILSYPHNMVARSKYNGYQSLFFESVSTSFDCLEFFRFSEAEKPFKRAFSQWRLDCPTAIKSPEWTERGSQLFSVAEKILTRGCITLCSPYVEEKLLDKFRFNKSETQKIAISHLLMKQPVTQDYWLDSEAENIFFYEVLPKVFGDVYSQWVMPQIDIPSLLPGYKSAKIHGRVDFLICHPGNKQPLIVEIDGQQHNESKEADRIRDETLRRYGYEVIRIPAEELNNRSERYIEALKHKFPQESFMVDNSKLIQFIQAAKIIHQTQITILQAIKYGFLDLDQASLWDIVFQFPPDSFFNKAQIEELFKLAIDDIIAFLRHLSELYSIDVCSGKPSINFKNTKTVSTDAISISFSNKVETNRPTFLISNIYVPFQIANEVFSTNAAILDMPQEKTLLYFLEYLFRKKTFWEGQLDAILRAFQCKDAILLLPTGGGKSIAFQLASLLLPGRTIVIEPIISLIEDQLDNLASYGIDRCTGITSMIYDPEARAEVVNRFSQAEYLFVYIAPERFQTVEFREAFRALTVHTPINIIIIDEAHCVSEWGHNFRTSYLNIGRVSREYCKSSGLVPPLIALTGTASRAVLKDVQRELQIEDFDAIITPKTFDRPELKFNVIQCKSSEKFAHLKGYLGQMLPNLFAVPRTSLFQPLEKDTYSGLVFCPWVNGDYGVVKISRKIQSEMAISNDFYSGKAPKYERSAQRWSKKKQVVAKQFKYNMIPLLTCTNAFGMGIDKPNIRYTIHYGLPNSIESFYQEAGRAGRDRKKAYCTILASNDNHTRSNQLLDPGTPIETIADILKETRKDEGDDVTRALYFHTEAFRGIENELNDVEQLLNNQLPNYDNRSNSTIVYTEDQERETIEKSIHRLLILGIVEDYTINYSKKEFRVKTTGVSKEDIIKSYGKYVSGYLGSRSAKEVEKATGYFELKQSEFILEMLRLLLRLIYNVIEQGRRRALNEMFLATIKGTSDSSIRQSILNYLEETEHSELIDELINDDDGGLLMVKSIIDDICSPNEAAEIRGQVSRHLEAYPDHPGLLMLRALTESLSKGKNIDVIRQNFMASIKSSIENYFIEETHLYQFIAWSIKQIGNWHNELADELTEEVITAFQNQTLAKTLVSELPESLAVSPALFLLNHLNNKCKLILPIIE